MSSESESEMSNNNIWGPLGDGVADEDRPTMEGSGFMAVTMTRDRLAVMLMKHTGWGGQPCFDIAELMMRGPVWDLVVRALEMMAAEQPGPFGTDMERLRRELQVS